MSNKHHYRFVMLLEEDSAHPPLQRKITEYCLKSADEGRLVKLPVSAQNGSFRCVICDGRGCGDGVD